MDISVHDNRLLSYCVLSDVQEIRLHTVYDEREPPEYTDIVFSGVVAYCFEQDDFSTILFDVEEANIATVYASSKEQFEIGQKYGWPGTWNTSEQATLTHLASHGIKGFVLSSSTGMNGWVLARSMRKILL